ncbi:unnamed protein product [Didymodactylos carnosus]|uniref:Uncharacterized protein n=2 Tax=Didymodactylos carnosus TaxID=1234261 RepID=A0A814MUE6_9BILA|nr:unnamed protein product [Didymodactylos carnosus]CAF3848964.1 unnamed protein product [Didymodactylos carnosus]
MLNVPHTEQNNYLIEMCEQFGRMTRDFIARGKLYDSSIDMDELFQAARILWFLGIFEIILNENMQLTDSTFGYSLLYPYTDNFIGSNDATKECKQDFGPIFFRRLVYGEEHAALLESLILANSFQIV